METEHIDISVVVPLLNEQENLKQLHKEIVDALDGKFAFEVIYIDDGSTDDSPKILESIFQEDKRARVIVFRKNFGQTAALSAGFRHSRGKIIIPLDADLQNDPNDIPSLVEKLNEGYDIVSGWRKDRKDKAVTRKFPSRIANWLISKITGVSIHDFGCTLKAYKSEVLRETRLYGEMHRFIPALAQWSGARVGEIVVNHRPRTAGKTKYGLNRTIKVVLDLITVKFLGSFSTKPLYIFGSLGVLSGFGAILSVFALFYQKIQGLPMNRNPLLVLAAMMVTASIQFIMMGLLAEMLVRTYHESQNRPTYVIRKLYNHE